MVDVMLNIEKFVKEICGNIFDVVFLIEEILSCVLDVN